MAQDIISSVSHQVVDKTSCVMYDAVMPRTTLSLDSDVLELAREHARRRGHSLGEAVSELVRRGARRELSLEHSGPFAVVRLPSDSPVVTPEHVTRALDDLS